MRKPKLKFTMRKMESSGNYIYKVEGLPRLDSKAAYFKFDLGNGWQAIIDNGSDSGIDVTTKEIYISSEEPLFTDGVSSKYTQKEMTKMFKEAEPAVREVIQLLDEHKIQYTMP